ncbi:MAG: sugar phosphate isomerase/epimerase [Anaerolineae bacterium]|nr:sugar phosphate isomerase/epimerase [Anaerolineae bacterium]
MKLSVMAYSFARALGTGEMTLPQVLEYIASLAVPAVELMDVHVAAAGEQQTLAALERLGLTVSCYDLVSTDLVQTTPNEQGAALAQLRRELDVAERLGAKTALVVPGRWKTGIERDYAREALVAGLADLGAYAAARGISLTIEDHSLEAATGCTAESLEHLCAAAAPHLYVTFDTGNFVFGDQDPLAAWERLAPRVRHVHVKDWEVLTEQQAAGRAYRRDLAGRAYRGTALGCGIIPNPAIVDRVARSGYSDYLSAEYEGEGDPRVAVSDGVRYLRGLLTAAGV